MSQIPDFSTVRFTAPSKPIDTGDARIRGAAENPADGTIWASFDDGCLPAGDMTVRSCLRIVAVRAGKAIYDGDVGWFGGDLYYPRIAVDGNGNAVVVHGYSSSAAFPSIGVFVLGENGGLTPSYPVAVGTEAHDNPRFGDYFGAAPDGSGGVWIVGENGTFVTGGSFDSISAWSRSSSCSRRSASSRWRRSSGSISSA